MTSEEHARRIAVILAMHEALGRKLTDAAAAMIARSTERIPYPWLRDACLDLASSWDESQRNPGAPAIHRVAFRLAGFRARYATYDYFDPTPATVRWWPPEGKRLPERLAQLWNESPQWARAMVEAECGAPILLPDGSSQPQLEAGE